MSIFTKKTELHFNDYLDVVLRKWEIVVITFLVCLGASLYVNLSTPPLYEATATLVVNPDLPQALMGPTNAYVTEMNEDLSIETQLRIIRSDPVAEGVVRRLNLVDEAKDPTAFQDFVKRVKQALTIERVPQTRLFLINAHSNKGQEAADVANAAAEVFIEQSMQTKFDASRRSIAWLTEQIMEMRKKLEESERSISEFRSAENITATGETADFQVQKLGGIQNQFIELQTKENELKGKIQQVQELLRAKEIRFVPKNLTDSLNELSRQMTVTELDLQKAKLEYKEKHPTVVNLQEEIKVIENQIRRELEKSLKVMDAEYRGAQSQEKVLQDALNSMNKTVLSDNTKQIKMSILKRDVETYNDLYNILVRKLKTADLTRGVGESNYRIIEYAKNQHWPIRPRKRRNFFLGFIVGLTLSISVAFLLEYFDQTIRTPEDIEENLDLPILISIPKIRGRDIVMEGDSIFLSKDRPQSVESIAFHALRTNLRFGELGLNRKTFLVTSTSPSEGKTTIVTNLGISFANTGTKTIIIDTDLRKPRIHTIFNRPNDRGVSNSLEGDVRDFIQNTSYENLDVLTSGPHVSAPFELLETDKMRALVEKLRNLYDVVIFDSPPIGSVVDASLLSTYVDGVIFVLRSGKIETMHVRHSKEQLEKVKAQVLGVVLNNLDRSLSKYYYSYYYYRGYYGDRTKEIIKGIKESIHRI